MGRDARERELERGLLEHLRDLLRELGRGFAFVGSQVPLEVDGQSFYIDLLFYHVRLHSYFVIELKVGPFKPEYAGKLADVADLRERFGHAVLPLALDVTNSEQVQQVVQRAYAHFGNLDVLVNNAGASLFAATEEASDEQILGLFDANYLGMVRVLRAALPFLRKQGSGHILGVSSGLGITALPLIGF